MGVSRRTVVRLEAGLHVPGSPLVHAFKHFLGFGTSGLVGGWMDVPDYDRPQRSPLARMRRCALGLALGEVAARAGVSAATLSRLERGLADPRALVDRDGNGMEALLAGYAPASDSR